MKYIYIQLTALIALLSFVGCSLDEYNPTQGSDESLVQFERYLGMQTYCYSPLYDQLYTASDFLSVAESGTDNWLTARNSTNTQQLFYYEGLVTSTNATNKVFTQAYSVITTCNTIIARADNVLAENTRDVEILAAEAHCLRAFYYLLLTTYYGEITLNLEPIGVEMNLTPTRNTYQEIYEQIINDLKYAEEKLEVEPYKGNYARVTKKTAKGLLARAYTQGAGEGLEENGISYWQRAKEVAEELINNKDLYNAYLYDDVEDVWAWANNRKNKEALFVASGPQPGTPGFTSGAYTANKLFTFTMANPNKCNDIYKTSDKQNYFYGRVNNNVYAPSKYLIDCFNDYDKRWENSFVTAFTEFTILEAGWTGEKKLEITSEICDKYGIDKQHIGKFIYPYVELGIKDYGSDGGNNVFVKGIWPKGVHNGDFSKVDKNFKNAYVHPYPLAEDEDRFAIYLSKERLSKEDKAKRIYATCNIDDLFETQTYGTPVYHSAPFDEGKSNIYHIFPSLSKFNWSYDGLDYGGNLQCRVGDMFIMRMAEIYLIAAEANVMLGNNVKAAEYLNILRKRACRDEKYLDKMLIQSADMEDVFNEYACELCGEFNRWPLLKRHRAIEDRLKKYNGRAALNFNPQKHYLRPISYDFLNQIDNADEYGTNGY